MSNKDESQSVSDPNKEVKAVEAQAALLKNALADIRKWWVQRGFDVSEGHGRKWLHECEVKGADPSTLTNELSIRKCGSTETKYKILKHHTDLDSIFVFSKGETGPVIKVNEQSISTIGLNRAQKQDHAIAVKGMVKFAKNQWKRAITLEGPEEFKRIAWKEAWDAGLYVAKYTPDIKTLREFGVSPLEIEKRAEKFGIKLDLTDMKRQITIKKVEKLERRILEGSLLSTAGIEIDAQELKEELKHCCFATAVGRTAKRRIKSAIQKKLEPGKPLVKRASKLYYGI